MYLDSGDSGALRTLAQPRDTSIPTLRTSEPKGPPPEDPEEPTPPTICMYRQQPKCLKSALGKSLIISPN